MLIRNPKRQPCKATAFVVLNQPKQITTYSERTHLIQNITKAQRMRTELFNILGHKCVKCGIDDIRLLTFDHKNNDGAADRKAHRGDSHNMYYVNRPIFAILKLQVLCHNCNILRTYEEGHRSNLNDKKFFY